MKMVPINQSVVRLILAIFFALMISSSLNGMPIDPSSTWTGGTGTWSTGNMWDPMGIPKKGNNVFIDDAKAKPSVVTLNQNADIEELNVSQGDALVIQDGKSLTLKGITNDGLIVMQSMGKDTKLILTGGKDVTIAGQGKLRMDNFKNNSDHNQISAAKGERLINPEGHDIFGAGQIGLGKMPLTNKGKIVARHGTLRIKPNANGVENTGTLEGTTDGLLVLAKGSYNNKDGTILGNGGPVTLGSDVNIKGGTLTASGNAGRVQSEGQNILLEDVTLGGGTGINGFLEKSAVTLKGTITNNTTFRMMNTLYLSGDVDLQGKGVLSMVGDNRIDKKDGTLTNGSDHTIKGTGKIDAKMTNNGGDVFAEGGMLTLSGENKTNNGIMGARKGGTLKVNVDIDGTGRWEAVGKNSTLKFGNVNVTTPGNVDVKDGGQFIANGVIMTAGQFKSQQKAIVNVKSTISLSKGLIFGMTDTANWSWGPDSILELTGGVGSPEGSWGSWGFLEIGGSDFGTDPLHHGGAPKGFLNNFDLTELRIGPGAHILLQDQINNGNRNGDFGHPEALYVDILSFADTFGLLDLNGLHLYYGRLEGNGQIINKPVPEPSTVFILASGLAGLLGLRRRRLQKLGLRA